MSLPHVSPAQQLLVGAALCLAAAATAVAAWLHSLSIGSAAFLCGSAEAHCWACYAAPALAFLAVAVLTAPIAQPAARPLQVRP